MDYIKYLVVYGKTKYLCGNRRLTDYIDKARVFCSAREAYNFAHRDIDAGIANVYSYVTGQERRVVEII